jgi:hypothetical protein
MISGEELAGRRRGLRLRLRTEAFMALGLCAVFVADDAAAQPRRAQDRLSPSMSVFSHGPTDIANVTGVVPLGNLNPGGGHVLAVNHMYLGYPVPVSDGAYAYPVNAMGDGAMVMVIQGQVDGRTDPEYELYISHTPQLTSYFIHIHELSSRLQSFLGTVPEAAWIRLGGVDRIVLLGQLGAPAPLPVVAGEQLGMTRSYSSNWDVGVIDSRQHAYFEGRGARRYPTFDEYLALLGVDAQPPLAGQQTINAACFINYLQDDLRAEWAALLTSTTQGCGRSGWDLPGKLRGAWFNPAVDAASPPPLFELESAAVSIIPDNLAPTSRVQIGIASGSPFAALDPGGSYPQLRHPLKVTMDQAPGARINPDPAQVGPSTGTVCYDLEYEGDGGRRYNSILFRMLSDRSVAIKLDPTPSVGPRCSSTALGEPDATWTTTYVR